MNSSPIRVCIVEDDDHIRETYIQLIENFSGFRCVGGYGHARPLIGDIRAKKPDIVLMDINLPGISGIECTRRLRHVDPSLLIIMITVYEDATHIFDSLAAGAVGYLLKSAKEPDIINALRLALSGGAPMSAQIARKVVQSFRKTPSASVLDILTNREYEVLKLLSRGLIYKEIAGEMFISIDKVKTHIRNIYKKLEVHTKTEAVMKLINTQ